MKTAIITGASSGIGKEFVKKVHQTGEFERIWVIARNREKLLDLEYSLDEKIVPVCLDLTVEEDLESFKALLSKEKPDISHLNLEKQIIKTPEFQGFLLVRYFKFTKFC